MEAISTHAKQARNAQEERRHSEESLAEKVGATIGDAYLVQPDDDGDDDYVMVVTGVSHHNDEYFNADSNTWRRPLGVTQDEFERGIIVHAEFYDIHSYKNGAIVTHDDPFQEPNIYKNTLKKFPRKRLETGADGSTFALPSLL